MRRSLCCSLPPALCPSRRRALPLLVCIYSPRCTRPMLYALPMLAQCSLYALPMPSLCSLAMPLCSLCSALSAQFSLCSALARALCSSVLLRSLCRCSPYASLSMLSLCSLSLSLLLSLCSPLSAALSPYALSMLSPMLSLCSPYALHMLSLCPPSPRSLRLRRTFRSGGEKVAKAEGRQRQNAKGRNGWESGRIG